MVIAPITQAKFELAETLSETERGAGGFGSTGKN
jgi:dUTP pyrophosphatase